MQPSGRMRPRRSLALKRKESAVWSALYDVGGEWCWVWNMEQIVGVWRGEAQGWAAAPVPEFPEQEYAVEDAQGRCQRAVGERAVRGPSGCSSSQAEKLEQLRRDDGVGPRCGIASPKQPEKAVSVEARIVSLEARRQARACAGESGRLARIDTSGARLPSFRPGGNKRRKGLSVALNSCCVRLLRAGGEGGTRCGETGWL